MLTGVRYYTGIHDPNRNPAEHGKMQRRLQAYDARGVRTIPMMLRYEKRAANQWRGREKGVDVRIAIDLLRLGQKGLYDVAIVVSEDSDLNEAIRDVYELRDYERWIAVENALPWSKNSHAKWLAAKRKRRIEETMSDRVADRNIYCSPLARTVTPCRQCLCRRHRVQVHLPDALDRQPGIVRAEAVQQRHQQFLIHRLPDPGSEERPCGG